VVNDLTRRRIQEASQALGFLDPIGGHAKYQAYQQKIAECLRTLPFHISEDERYEIAGAAIAAVLRSGRIDPSKQPLAYCKMTAIRLAKDHQRKKSGEVLVGEYPEECLSVKSSEGDPGCDGLGAGSDRSAEDEDVWDLVDEAVDGLARPRERDVLQRQSVGQNDDVIAEETGRTKNAVYQGRKHGVESVQGQLEQYIRPGHLKSPRSLGGER
jgi:DNA-directed RNA polymerase specialized sigma24 family protein